MAVIRSFYEYAKDHFDNKFFNALGEYLEETDPSILDLRLKKVRDIGEIELDDMEIYEISHIDLV